MFTVLEEKIPLLFVLVMRVRMARIIYEKYGGGT